jgi:hypothetical protein
MVNWFDLMRQAQGGAGLENFAHQFGLSPQQTNAAIAALMPAFAMGLQRAATDPTAIAQLFRVMSGGHYPNFWESASQAFTPQARQEGKEIIDQLFGSDEVSRRVAHQAADFSGVGVDVLQQMLPLLAGIVAGGLTKLAASQGAMLSAFANAPAGAGSGGQTGAGVWADLWGQWMSAGARPPEAKPEPEPEPPPEPKPKPPPNPFEEMMASFLAASTPPKKPPEAAPQPEPKVKPQPKPEPPPQARPPAPDAQNPFQAWGEMMEKGQEMQRQHLESLQSIFEGVWGRKPGGPGS